MFGRVVIFFVNLTVIVSGSWQSPPRVSTESAGPLVVKDSKSSRMKQTPDKPEKDSMTKKTDLFSKVTELQPSVRLSGLIGDKANDRANRLTRRSLSQAAAQIF